ncbi:MAG: hypothetical protein OQK82_00245 [Candidatus Pacearchaeota archaeon]|nr:hypothetical protein [Candidatus Pacearchaeota archaeon]
MEDGRLSVLIDRQEFGEEENQIRVTVPGLNPFDYEESGDDDFPKKYKASIDGVGELRAEAHIWPPNSDKKEYKLGGNAAARQGFYFYRNDRLIQAGGWNGLVQNQSEPHSSLARVRIDLPEKYDACFNLNVQKSAVVTPPEFEKAIAKSIAGDGDTFEDYRRTAQLVYRKKDSRAHKDFPMIPGEGMPKNLINRSKEILSPKKGRVRKISFEWVEFASGDLFEVNRDSKTINLNRAYRKELLAGLSASKTDLPLFKMLIFLLAKEDFNKSKVSGKRKEELEQINRLLIEAVRMGRG